jgi:hypothetical protein
MNNRTTRITGTTDLKGNRDNRRGVRGGEKVEIKFGDGARRRGMGATRRSRWRWKVA